MSRPLHVYGGSPRRAAAEEVDLRTRMQAKNRHWGRFAAKCAAAPFDFVERCLMALLMAPVRPLWRWLDARSEGFDRTTAGRIIAVTLYPALMMGTLLMGLYLTADGLTPQGALVSGGMLLGLGIVLAPLERLMPWSLKWREGKDSATDVLMIMSVGPWSFVAAPFHAFLTAWLVGAIHSKLSPEAIHELWPTSLHPILQVFLLLIVKDFFRYWYHRWMHESAFMWRWHSVHHSSARLYWFNGVRAHPLEHFVSDLIWVIPFTLIQAPAEIVFVTGLVSLVIGRFQHTNLNARLGALEYLFSGPNNHRYHHSKDLREGNSNYGGDVMLWDHLFGTFHPPKGGRPSDDIGVAFLPDYPHTWLGLLLAPFRIGMWKVGMWKECRRRKLAAASGGAGSENDSLKKFALHEPNSGAAAESGFASASS